MRLRDGAVFAEGRARDGGLVGWSPVRAGDMVTLSVARDAASDKAALSVEVGGGSGGGMAHAVGVCGRGREPLHFMLVLTQGDAVLVD